MTEQEIRDELMGVAANPDFQVNYLVEAGAGAGKTHTMIQRIVNQLVSGACRPENLVAITFTVKSTQEMQERLDKELRERRDAATDDGQRQMLDELVTAAGRMQVSTIHSFCQTMLETMPFASPYGMDMEVIEAGADAARAKQFFRRRYWGDASLFATARDRFGVRFGELTEAFCDRCLNNEAEIVYCGSQMPETLQLESDMQSYAQAVHNSLLQVLPVIGDDAKLLNPDLRELLSLSQQTFAASIEYSDALARLRNRASSLPLRYDSEEVEMFREALAQLSSPATAILVDPDYLAKHPLLQNWKEINEIWTKEDGLLLKDAVARLTHTYCMEPMLPLVDAYRQDKVEQGVASFDDLLLRVRDMLRDDPIARGYFHERYKVLYVDEFQDTNPVQAELLFYLTADESSFDAVDWKNCKPVPGSLFLVGDPKQAIYRFRGADIDMYDTVKKLFEAGVGEVRTLGFNFRSTTEICDLTEKAFAQGTGITKTEAKTRFNGGKYEIPHQAEYASMTSKTGSLSVARTVTYPAREEGETGYKGGDPKQVAAFIRTMIDQKAPVGKDGRAATPGDFMLLTWQRPEVESYVQALTELGIPANASGRQFLSEIEPIYHAVLHLKSMLAPQEDLPLARVLRTCYGIEFSALRVYLQRTGLRHLHETLYLEKLKEIQRALEQEETPDDELLELCGVLEELIALRQMVAEQPAMSVIERLLDGGYAVWHEETDPKRHSKIYARVQQYLEMVRGSEERSFPALAAHAIACADNEVERELTLKQEDDCVQVMNIHKAKGLQGEVVILAYSAGKALPARKHIERDGLKVREYASLMTTGRRASAIAWPTDWNDCKLKGRECKKLVEEDYRKTERVRLLYVAATRAKSMLVVCGRPQLTEEEKKKGAKLSRKGVTAWQQIADVCTPADKNDPLFGKAFESLLTGKTTDKSLTVNTAQTRKVALNTAELEWQLEETARKCAEITAYAITPSKLDHQSHQTGRNNDPDEEAAIPAGQPVDHAKKQPVAVSYTGPYGPDWGTIVHRVMELAMLGCRFDADSLRGFARQAVVETLPGGLQTKTQRAQLMEKDEEQDAETTWAILTEAAVQSAAFVTREDSALRQLLEGAEIYPELPFILRECDLDSNLYRHLSIHISDERAEGKTLDVQGIIDLALWKDGQWIVVDYKTDIIRYGESADAFRQRLRQEYTPQIASYAQVLERLGKGSVTRACLCAIHLGGELVDLNIQG